jgi:diguanylate cyclase (GGDEF)-like protein
MSRIRPIAFASSLRLVLGLVGLLALPSIYPGMWDMRWVFLAYLAWAALAQALIWRNMGGTPRVLIDSVIDAAILTFVMHRVGSVANMMISVYVVAVVMNTLVVGRRVGFFFAMVASVMYTSVIVAEAVGALPYAPDAPPWAAGTQPTLGQGLIVAAITSLIMVMMAIMVGTLVRMIRIRETQLVRANALLEELSQRDPLTQLFNRRHLLQRIEEELAWVRRGRPMAVAMLDLDRFKRVNDERGHLQGDAMLRDLADALKASSRATDVPGRFGGDEFLVLLPDTSPEQAEVVADRLRKAVGEVGLQLGDELAVTASIGLAFGLVTDSPADLIRRADLNTYHAKQGGGDRVAVHPDPSAPPRSPSMAPSPDPTPTGEPDPCVS